jgi:hypothetical protein
MGKLKQDDKQEDKTSGSRKRLKQADEKVKQKSLTKG